MCRFKPQQKNVINCVRNVKKARSSGSMGSGKIWQRDRSEEASGGQSFGSIFAMAAHYTVIVMVVDRQSFGIFVQRVNHCLNFRINGTCSCMSVHVNFGCLYSVLYN